jgi:thymidylate synthase (FAD)
MKVIKQSHKILTPINGQEIIKNVEYYGRTCYQSRDKICEGSAERFIKSIITRGHESVLEHVSITVDLITNLRVLPEITRHRLAAYSVSSTRYINYKDGLTFIQPCWLSDDLQGEWHSKNYNRNFDLYSIRDLYWLEHCESIENTYLRDIKEGGTPEEASNYLSKDIATEMVMTANLREWRHIFKLRTHKASHPQMTELMIPLLKEFQEKIPVIFDDIEVTT